MLREKLKNAKSSRVSRKTSVTISPSTVGIWIYVKGRKAFSDRHSILPLVEEKMFFLPSSIESENRVSHYSLSCFVRNCLPRPMATISL